MEDNVLKLKVIHTEDYDPLGYHLDEALRLAGNMVSVPLSQAMFIKLIELQGLYKTLCYEEGFIEDEEEDDEEEEGYVEEIVASDLSCQEE